MLEEWNALYSAHKRNINHTTQKGQNDSRSNSLPNHCDLFSVSILPCHAALPASFSIFINAQQFASVKEEERAEGSGGRAGMNEQKDAVTNVILKGVPSLQGEYQRQK